MKKKIVEIKPANRHSVLEERRRLKMARTAHAYVRGSTQHFYDWLIRDHFTARFHWASLPQHFRLYPAMTGEELNWLFVDLNPYFASVE